MRMRWDEKNREEEGSQDDLVLLLGGGKEVRELLIRSLGEGSLLPHVRSKITVGATDSIEGSHGEVATGLGGTLRGSVNILDTGELQDLLGDGSSDDTSTTRSGHKAQTDRAALASELHGDGVRHTDVVTPVATTDRDDSKLGDLDSSTDGGGNLLGALVTDTDVTVAVTDDDVGLEAGTLTGRSLLLDRGQTHDLILQVRKEVIDNLVFLDGNREEVELLDLLDVASLHETANLSDGSPGILALSVCTTTTATATATSLTTSTATTTTELTATTTTTSTTGSAVCHLISVLYRIENLKS
jgi:hypothetical protein